MTHIKPEVNSRFGDVADTSADTLGQRYPKMEPVLEGLADTLGYLGYLFPGRGSCVRAAHVRVCAHVRAAWGKGIQGIRRYHGSRLSGGRGADTFGPRYPQGIPKVSPIP